MGRQNYFSIFLTLCFIFVPNLSTAEPVLECIEDFNDFQQNKWTAYPTSGFLYVGTSSEISNEEFNGKLDGHGIFYFPHAEGYSASFLKAQENFKDIRPMYMYVKYYSHVKDSNVSRVFGQPSQHPDSGSAQYFESTSNFRWNEVLFEVDVEILKGFYLERLNVVTTKFEENDYFFLDRMIVVQGLNISAPPTTQQAVDEVKLMCGWGSDEGSTTSTSTASTTTTERPGGFHCEATGSFADPNHCNQFHVCYDDGAGGFIDDLITCPVNTVWCQSASICETEAICPCDHSKFS